MPSLLDLPGLDTSLARALHLSGRVDALLLGESLERVRLGRREQGGTLARELLARGLLNEAELHDALRELAGGRPEAWEVGAAVAGLQIQRLLGSGGMGSVYLATDLETGAEVAVKTLALGDPDLLERFQREAEAQARVDRHPCIARIHRAGVAHGRSYLVLDVASGGDLERRLREKGPLSPLAAAQLVRSLAEGLAHAHARGVLHRDLKPSNVLFDEAGAPKLTDFGLARLLDVEGLTRTGEILGTPAYMAPEQAQGLPQDERTDVYGLGGVLFAALTGRAPFQRGQLLQTLDAVVNEPPTSPRDLNPEVPGWLASVCLRCLAKDPSARYPSAAALAEALLAPDARATSSLPLAALGLISLALLAAGLMASQPQAGQDSPALPPRSPRTGPSPTKVVRDFRAELELAHSPSTRANLLEAALSAQPDDIWTRDRAREPLWESSFAEIRRVLTLAQDRVAVEIGPTPKPGVPTTKRTLIVSLRDGRELAAFPGGLTAVSPSGARLALFGAGELRIIDSVTLEVQRTWSLPLLARADFLSEETLVVALEAPESAGDQNAAQELATLHVGAASPTSLGSSRRALRSLIRISDSTFATLAGTQFVKAPTLTLVHVERGELWRTESIGLPRGFALSPDLNTLAVGTSLGSVFMYPLDDRPRAGAPAPIQLMDQLVAAGTHNPQAADCLLWPRADVFLVLQPDGAQVNKGWGKHTLKVWRRAGSSWSERPQRIPAPGWRFCATRDRRGLVFSHRAQGLWLHLVSGFAPECARDEPMFED